mmetsp:Transcript_5152/g.8431  ORF Transcript_5152/g.8431 Transcript_5152/m.8431 type:complete len:239 (-) Transcript_5152:64-780(-)
MELLIAHQFHSIARLISILYWAAQQINIIVSKANALNVPSPHQHQHRCQHQPQRRRQTALIRKIVTKAHAMLESASVRAATTVVIARALTAKRTVTKAIRADGVWRRISAAAIAALAARSVCRCALLSTRVTKPSLAACVSLRTRVRVAKVSTGVIAHASTLKRQMSTHCPTATIRPAIRRRPSSVQLDASRAPGAFASNWPCRSDRARSTTLWPTATSRRSSTCAAWRSAWRPLAAC